jgi:hypothetical protein
MSAAVALSPVDLKYSTTSALNRTESRILLAFFPGPRWPGPVQGGVLPEGLHRRGIVGVVGALRILDPLGRLGDGSSAVLRAHGKGL